MSAPHAETFTAVNRPWTRWWWMGSALDEAEITRHLELFHAAGMGGVEVSPIYGARGTETDFVPFLSDRWIDLLSHTLLEAQRLGMGVDLIGGTGWPYGGPWVPDTDAPVRLAWEKFTPGTAAPEGPEGSRPLATDAANGIAVFLARTGQQVKRAAPGGEGNVVDPLSPGALKRYLSAFDEPLAKLPPGLRCVFNDSYEVFGANTTPDILAEFSARRGYDLRDHLPALRGKGADAETVQRVRTDYRETIGDLVREAFLGNWNDWAKAHGLKTRNQAHGSPGNLLDLYAAADIAETEVFGPPRLAAAGLTPLRPVPPDFDSGEEGLICRMASSAAHVAGRPLASSESFTWMGEHGCVPLEHGKIEVDTLFTLGINHIFFHGTPSSPADAAWPGNLFYATTHVAPTNPWWRDLGALNTYIARCQARLQAGFPDNDLLLYFPYHDILASESGARDGLQFLTFHNTRDWLRDAAPEFTQTARALERGGWRFDMISDRQLVSDVVAEAGAIVARTGGARWRALVIAGGNLLPTETLERIADLATQGAPILVLGDLPRDVPGLADLSARRKRLAAARAALVATGNFRVGSDLASLLSDSGIAREPIAEQGIEFIRRRDAAGAVSYFVANPGSADWSGWVRSAQFDGAAHVFDPMRGETHTAPGRTVSQHTEYHLEIPAGGSLFVESAAGVGDTAGLPAPFEPCLELPGPWAVDFIEGGPSLPAPRTVNALSDWTIWPDPDQEALRAFSGTARYRTTFDLPADTDAGAEYRLELREVCHSARISLNGAVQGTVFARPWRLALSGLRPAGNALEIEVTNLMANRLSALEREQGEAWRPFLMVNIRYKPFDAADWDALPSGLLGPVRLHVRPTSA